MLYCIVSYYMALHAPAYAMAADGGRPRGRRVAIKGWAMIIKIHF